LIFKEPSDKKTDGFFYVAKPQTPITKPQTPNTKQQTTNTKTPNPVFSTV